MDVFPVFPRGQRSSRQANLGNTVLVNIGSCRNEIDRWCLGYIQDIADDEVFIDFNCIQLPPCWISSKFVWYHYLFDLDAFPYDFVLPYPLHVQVALQNEPDGPYLFRPAQLWTRPSVGNLYLCYVSTNTTSAESDTGKNIQIVHYWQVVGRLPVNEPSLSGRLNRFGSFDEILIVRQIVQTGKVKAISMGEQELLRITTGAVRRAGFFLTGEAGFQHRIFVGTGEGTIIFLLFDLYQWTEAFSEGIRREWTPESGLKFSRKVEADLQRCKETKIYPVTWLDLCITETDPFFHGLPLEIVSEILLYLDVHSQSRAKRVCMVWSFLLNASSEPVCVLIDFTNIKKEKGYARDEDAGYQTALLLERAVSSKTKALGIININNRTEEPDRVMGLVRDLLLLKRTVLHAILIRTCYVFTEIRRRGETAEFCHTLHHIPILMPVCRRLLLSNFTTIGYPVCDCYQYSNTGDKTWDTFRTVSVTFPHLVFDSAVHVGARKLAQLYVDAIEPHLPPIDDIKKQFKERHKDLVQTLPYPGGWQKFKNFLKRHTFSETTASDTFWDGLDMRNFGQLPLSKLVLLLLDSSFSLAFDNHA